MQWLKDKKIVRKILSEQFVRKNSSEKFIGNIRRKNLSKTFVEKICRKNLSEKLDTNIHTVGIHIKYTLNTSITKGTKEKVVHFWQDQSRFLEAPFVRMLRMRSASLKI